MTIEEFIPNIKKRLMYEDINNNSKENVLENNILRNYIEKQFDIIISELTLKQQLVIKLHFYMGKNIKQISKILNIRQEEVRKIISKFISIMKRGKLGKLEIFQDCLSAYEV